MAFGLVAALTGLAGLAIHEPRVATAQTTVQMVWFVAPDGDDGAAGTATAPLRTIERAVQLSNSGDVVDIAPGTYHESVQVYRKALHLRGAASDDVVLDGARVIDDWTAAEGRWWSNWSTSFERAGAPFTTVDRPEAGWPEQFFVDGTPLREVSTLSEVSPGTFHYDRDAGRVWLGDDPTDRVVEGSDLSWGIYLNHADGSSLSGVTVQRYATQTAHMAAVRAYGDDLAISDVTVRHNARIGLSAIGDRISIADVRATANGHLGLHAHRSTDLQIVDAEVTHNNGEAFDPKHSAGGIKVTDTDGLLVADSVVSHNAGPGIWTDLDVTAAVIRSSVASHNLRSGVEVELSTDVVVVDNIAEHNGEAGVWVLESSDVEVWHNSLFSNVRDVWVLDGDRSDLVGVRIKNNLLGGGSAGAPALLNVDDWTEVRSAAEMEVEIDANRYWLAPGSPTTNVSRWARWPSSLALSATMDQHRMAVGAPLDDLTIAADNPLVRSATDARQPVGSPAGVALSDEVRLAGELPSGAHPAGAISPARTLGDGHDGGDSNLGDDTDGGTGGDVVATPPPIGGDGETTRSGPSTIDSRATTVEPAPADRIQSPDDATVTGSRPTETSVDSATPPTPSTASTPAPLPIPAPMSEQDSAFDEFLDVVPADERDPGGVGGWSEMVRRIEVAVLDASTERPAAG